MNTKLSETLPWLELVDYAINSGTSFPLANAFQNDRQRFETYSLEVGELFLDYSKNWLNNDIWQSLLALASAANLVDAKEKMFKGHKVNVTENRAALHTALRDLQGLPLYVDDRDIMRDIRNTHHKIRSITEAVRNRQWCGYAGKYITDVVNIGIGGSHLGPEMVCHALKDYSQNGPNVHFVSNVDFCHISGVLETLRPETTLFIISSKSFGTQETLANAEQAKQWIMARSSNPASIAKHFLAITSKPEVAQAFGIPEANILPMWDWVGGRYSLWSAVGLPIAMSIGMDRFENLLDGAHDMDSHFLNAPLEANMPVILALLGVWYSNFLQINNQVIIPYSEQLSLFPNYMQQCDMESNGKSVHVDGTKVKHNTGPIIWGATGTNCQHAFFQLLHQGTHIIPSDFIGVVSPHHRNIDQHKMLLANLIAQSEALMLGKTPEQARVEMLNSDVDASTANTLKQHRAFDGNRPSTTLLLSKLTPHSLGQLIALYEHKVFCQGVIWQINSFDQWGVELGKKLSESTLAELRDPNMPLDHDGSTNGLLSMLREKTSSSEKTS